MKTSNCSILFTRLIRRLALLSLFGLLAMAAPARAAKEQRPTLETAGSGKNNLIQPSAVFMENRGQWADRSIHFSLESGGGVVNVTDSGLLFELPSHATRRAPEVKRHPGTDLASRKAKGFSMSLAGSRRVTPNGEAKSEKVHCRGGDSAEWRENVTSWSTLMYHDPYPGIDLRVAAQTAGVKYEFVVAPGVDWRPIRVQYDGIERLELRADGSLLIHLGDGWPPLVDEVPFIYQVRLGERVKVAGGFVLCDGNTIGFAVDGPIDSGQPLIIDPQLSWCTSLPGAASGVAADAAGNVYVTGKPNGLPYVTKLSPSGAQLWSTSFSSPNSSTYPAGIALDGQGNIYVTGETRSNDWVRGSAATNFNGGLLDMFLAAFDPSGNPLWSGCYGGENWDRGFGIATSSGGVIAVAGYTLSTNWPPNPNLNARGFLLYTSVDRVYNSSGLMWNDSQTCNGVAIDSEGQAALVVGVTKHCQYFPPPQGGYTICNDSAFVTKWGGIGHQWTTLLPGSVAHSVALDAARNVYVSGLGYSGSPPAVLTKLNPSGTTLWSVNVGGGTGYLKTAVAVDRASNVVVVGTSFVEKLTAGGTSLWRMNTPCGTGNSVAVDGAGNILVAGENFCAKIQPSSAVRAVIQPPEAVAAGARWRRVGTVDWRESGQTETGIPPGQHTIEFAELRGWATPCSVAFTLLDGQTLDTTNAYSPAQVELSWTRLLGGTNTDYASAVAADHQGNVLLAGRTASSGWVSGGFDTNYTGEGGFVAKLDVKGVPLWSTYLKATRPYGIAADAQGNVLVTGDIGSAGWISGGWITNYQGGGRDGFVVKLSAAGAHLWSSYLGGSSGQEVGRRVAVDGGGNILVMGFTGSSNWVSGGFDTTFNGGYDTFVIKLSSAGTHLWSTYIGGSAGDYGYGLTTDTTGNCWVSGNTSSSNWVSGGFDTRYDGDDAFLAKLSPAGSHLWSTYLGGSGYESGDGIAVDANGNSYAVGSTSSSNWVSGGFDTSFGGGLDQYGGPLSDGYVVKVGSAGQHIWSTYLGGTNYDSCQAVTVDRSGCALITGRTASANWVSGGLATDYACGTPLSFVAKLATNGTSVWSSYLPDEMNGYYNDIATDIGGSVLLAGSGIVADVHVTKLQHVVLIRDPRSAGGNTQFSIEADGLPGWRMAVESTSALTNPIAWQVEAGARITNTAPGRFEVQVPRQGARRFYRVHPTL